MDELKYLYKYRSLNNPYTLKELENLEIYYANSFFLSAWNSIIVLLPTGITFYYKAHLPKLS